MIRVAHPSPHPTGFTYAHLSLFSLTLERMGLLIFCLVFITCANIISQASKNDLKLLEIIFSVSIPLSVLHSLCCFLPSSKKSSHLKKGHRTNYIHTDKEKKKDQCREFCFSDAQVVWALLLCHTDFKGHANSLILKILEAIALNPRFSKTMQVAFPCTDSEIWFLGIPCLLWTFSFLQKGQFRH